MDEQELRVSLNRVIKNHLLIGELLSTNIESSEEKARRCILRLVALMDQARSQVEDTILQTNASSWDQKDKAMAFLRNEKAFLEKMESAYADFLRG